MGMSSLRPVCDADIFEAGMSVCCGGGGGEGSERVAAAAAAARGVC